MLFAGSMHFLCGLDDVSGLFYAGISPENFRFISLYMMLRPPSCSGMVLPSEYLR